MLRGIEALVAEGEERVRVTCSLQCNYPYQMLPMDCNLRYGTQGIIASLRPAGEAVPAVPSVVPSSVGPSPTPSAMAGLMKTPSEL